MTELSESFRNIRHGLGHATNVERHCTLSLFNSRASMKSEAELLRKTVTSACSREETQEKCMASCLSELDESSVEFRRSDKILNQR